MKITCRFVVYLLIVYQTSQADFICDEITTKTAVCQKELRCLFDEDFKEREGFTRYCRCKTVIDGLPLPENTLTYELFYKICSQHVKSLQELWINDADLQHIDHEIFERYTNLRKVNLAGNDLILNFTEEAKRLTEVDISHNNIRVVNDESFANLKSAKILNLSFNSLKKVNYCFKKLTELDEIYLNNNRIGTVEPDEFRHLKKLRILDLSHNLLTSIPPNFCLSQNEPKTIEPCKKTGYLDIMDPDTFEKLSKGEISSFDNTDCDDIQKVENIEVLYLSHNRIARVNCTFSKLKNLSKLSLLANRLEEISPSAFSALTKLQELNLAENKISEIPEGLLETLSNLQKLNVSNNNVTKFYLKNLETTPQLRELDVRNNNIKNINSQLFKLKLCSLRFNSHGIDHGDGWQYFEDNSVLDCTTPSQSEVTIPKFLVSGLSVSQCVLPEPPPFGEFEPIIGGGKLVPGTYIANMVTVQLRCNKGHILDGNHIIYCNNGTWSSMVAELGECMSVCPDIASSPSMRVTCVFKSGKETDNCTNAIEGTIAKLRCTPFHGNNGLENQAVRVCQNGSWGQDTSNCDSVTCGQKTVDATPLIINGRNVTRGEYPWQVALYTRQDKNLICGGSLLNQRVILTVAHCVTGEKGKPEPAGNYIVAVGKYYRPLGDPRDSKEVQISEVVKHIFIPDEYVGEIQNYLADLAILVTDETFELSRSVQPVCLDGSRIFEPQTEDYGHVTGWGFTEENAAPSEVLKVLQVPLVNMTTCKKNVPADFEAYLTSDKMCVGYLNNSTSVCKGDSGSPLVVRHDGRYYVTGIVSISPQSPTTVGGCNSQQYAYFTKVEKYMDFILRKLAQFPVRVF